MQGEVQVDGGVGADAALDRGVADVPLVPQGDVLHCRDDRRADQTGQAGQVLGQDRVALVRHGRRALLALVEELLGFEDFGALQVADFHGQALDRRGDDAQGGEVGGVTVARDDLGRDRLDGQTHLVGDVLLNRRIDVGEGADGARDGAGRDLLARRDQAAFGALELGVIAGQLQAEGHGLGVDAVRTTDGRGVFVFLGADFQRGQDAVDAAQQQVGRARQLHREAGVQHVRGGHALVQEAGFLADDFRHMGQEGDDVVLGGAFDLVDAVGVKDDVFALGPDGLG
ncbi:hypothetical protein D3C81_1455100 [compost metagenome]